MSEDDYKVREMTEEEQEEINKCQKERFEKRSAIDYSEEIKNEVLQSYLDEGYSYKTANNALYRLIRHRETSIGNADIFTSNFPSLIEFRKKEKKGELTCMFGFV